MLKVTPRRVRALIGAGRLTTIRVNPRLHLLLRADVAAFAQRARTPGRPPRVSN